MTISNMNDTTDAIREFANWKREQKAMTQTIWEVKVYGADRASYTLYHFANKADVMESIKSTWSQEPSAIHFERTDDQAILVTSSGDRSRVRVIVEAIPFDLMTEPTHF